jgi:hypothetical protein
VTNPSGNLNTWRQWQPSLSHVRIQYRNRYHILAMSFVTTTIQRQPTAFWIVFGVACVFEFSWFSCLNIGFFFDTITYLNYAMAIVGKNLDWGVAWINHEMVVTAITRRSLGYPLLLLLTGAPTQESFRGILLLQGAMAIAMPLLIYKTLKPYSARAALVTALAIVLTLEPFTYSKVLSSDQSFKFLLVLMVYLAGVVYRSPSGRTIALLAGAGLLMTLVRTQGGLMCLIIFLALGMAHRTYWRSLLAGFLALSVSISFVSLATALFVVPDFPTELVAATNGRVSNNLKSRFETLLFYNVYVARNNDLVPAEPKGSLQDLNLVLRDYASNFEGEWSNFQPKHYFGAFSGNPDSFVAEIYRNPNPYYICVIRLAAAEALSSSNEALRAAGSRLLMRLSLTAYLSHPGYIVSFLARFFLTSGTATTGQQIWALQYTSSMSGHFTETMGPASKEIFEIARDYAREFPQYMPPAWRDKPAQSFLDEVTKNPDEAYWYLLWEMTDRLKGKLESSALFYRSAHEFENYYFAKGLRFVENFSQFAFGVPTNYQSGSQNFDHEAEAILVSPDVPLLPVQMRNEIKNGMRLFALPQPQRIKDLLSYGDLHYTLPIMIYISLWLVVRTMVVTIIVATFLFSIPTAARWQASVIGLMLLFQAAVVSYITDVYIRYVDQVMPLAMLLAALTLTSFIRVTCNWPFREIFSDGGARN